MRRVFNTSDLYIDRKTYYNLIRNKLLENKISNNLFKILILTLEEISFRFIYNISNELAENNHIKKRVFKQIIFLSDQQITYTKRFITDQVLLIDSTFETNRLSLTLLIVIGITNTNKSFPNTYSFCKLESKISFNFLFKSLNYFIFTNNIAIPRVVLAD